VHVVELTEAGEAAFLRLRDAALAFDHRLRGGLEADELAALEAVLGRLAANVDPSYAGSEWPTAAPAQPGDARAARRR
jgi:MarR family transcriptional regulator, transcriptional regulator for hemolysin